MDNKQKDKLISGRQAEWYVTCDIRLQTKLVRKPIW